MATGPDKPIEQQLKAYARQRRQKFGVPGLMPEGMRERLASEVETVFGKRKGSVVFNPQRKKQESKKGVLSEISTWISIWWTRVVWGVGTVGVAVFVVVLLWRVQSQKRSVELAESTGEVAAAAAASTDAADEPPLESISDPEARLKAFLARAPGNRPARPAASSASATAATGEEMKKSEPARAASDLQVTTKDLAGGAVNSVEPSPRPVEQLVKTIRAVQTNVSSSPKVASRSPADSTGGVSLADAPKPPSAALETARSKESPAAPTLALRGGLGNSQQQPPAAAPVQPASASPQSDPKQSPLVASTPAVAPVSQTPVRSTAPAPAMASSRPRPAADTASASTLAVRENVTSAAPPKPGPAAPPAVVPVPTQPSAGGRYVRLEWGYRRNLNSPPLPQVLKEFSVEATGEKVRVVDSDGSIYEGSRLAAANEANRKPTLAFRVEGQSGKLKAGVVFEAEIVREAAGGERLQGRVRINGKDQFPLSASRMP